jgi:hypothetical protein
MVNRADKESVMSDPRQDLDRLRDRIKDRRYAVDERAVAHAMLNRPMMRLFLAPPTRSRRSAA